MKVTYADTFLKRFIGLMGRKSMQHESVLVLLPCNSIHTFFMRFSIDAIFIDKENRVIGVENGLKPWRISKVYMNALSVAEFMEGENPYSVGDIVKL